jgi:hypothetical protein
MRADPTTIDLMILRSVIAAYDVSYKAYLQALLEANANPQYPYLVRKAKELRDKAVADGSRMKALMDAVNLPTDHRPKAKRSK